MRRNDDRLVLFAARASNTSFDATMALKNRDASSVVVHISFKAGALHYATYYQLVLFVFFLNDTMRRFMKHHNYLTKNGI